MGDMNNEFTFDFIRAMPKLLDYDFIPIGYFPTLTFDQ